MMALSYEMDADVLVIRQRDNVEAEEIRTLMDAAFSSIESFKNIHLLWDASEAPAQASADKIKRLLQLALPLSGCIAIVVSNKLQYGLARMTVAYGEQIGLKIQIFDNADLAKTWLDSL